jgi:hypothetical protein
MKGLAKLGFSQSYTYFTWRTTKQELTEYFEELAHGPGRHYFRPNVWPNTPDILHEQLQQGGRAMFIARLVLAAGLAANYGVYGPAYELQEHLPREPGSEEYLDSEKYQLRHWDLERADSLAWLMKRLNAIRRAHAALQLLDGRGVVVAIGNHGAVAQPRRGRRARQLEVALALPSPSDDAPPLHQGLVDVPGAGAQVRQVAGDGRHGAAPEGAEGGRLVLQQEARLDAPHPVEEEHARDGRRGRGRERPPRGEGVLDLEGGRRQLPILLAAWLRREARSVLNRAQVVDAPRFEA